MGSNSILTGTVGGTTQDPLSSGIVDAKAVGTWVIAIAGVWVVLTLGVDIGATRDLAVAFAFLFMGSVFIIHGPDALKNLGFLGSGP